MSVVNPRPAVPPGNAIPEEVSQDEVTREVSGPADAGVGAVPAPVTSEATVPVQSSIETSLLHEVLRRQSAEGDDDDDKTR